MPWWLYVGMGAWAAPLVLFVAVAAREVWRDRREARTGEDGCTVLDFQRGNPRGVGRHDWPL